MRILITGGLGYLGARLVEYFSLKGYEINLASRGSAHVFDFPNNVALKVIDWNDEFSINQACKGCDVVIHSAGMNAALCSLDPVAALEANGVTTAKLLKHAVLCSVSKFIYFSTAHVYSDSLTGYFDEKSCTNNFHPYATSHKAGEDAVQYMSQNGDIDGIVLRISNAFGAPVRPETDCWALLVNDLCFQATTLSRLKLKTSGRQYRNFIPIRDLCEKVDYFLSPLYEYDLHIDHVYNLGSKVTISVYEMALLVDECYQSLFNEKLTVTIGGDDDVAFHSDKPLTYGVDKLLSMQGPSPDYFKQEIKNLLLFCNTHFLK